MAQAFDPAAATAAYLATLPPEAHAKAQAYTHGGYWLLLWGTLVGLVAAWIILRTGVLARLRARLEARGPRPWRAAAVVLLVYFLFEAVLMLPWSAYRSWWREGQYGMTTQPFAGWLAEWGIQTVIGVIGSAIIFSLVYWLIRRAPRTWWAWGGATVAAVGVVFLVLQPVFVEPLLNDYKPAPQGPIRDAIVEMARANGVPEDKVFVYNGSKQSERYTANVSGLFGTARVAISDVMFRGDADLAEVKAVVGHEMGHYKERHIFLTIGAFALLTALGFFLIDRLFPTVARWTGARNVAGLSDPAGYPVVVMIFGVLTLLATPITNSIFRIGESRADVFSLENVREPDGLARALVKTIEYRAATPSRLEEIIFYDHPAVGNRIRRAMEWKAAHPAPPGPPSAS